MQIRVLKEEDAKWMLEWMHDSELVKDLFTDFSQKKLSDCKEFIKESLTDHDHLHLAITDESDIYMGTVSLKHIDLYYRNAEFAITVRRAAMGKGYSIYAMNEILRFARDDLKLKEVCWCVSKNNARAIRFYDKNRFKRCVSIPLNISKHYPSDITCEYIWYHVRFEESISII